MEIVATGRMGDGSVAVATVSLTLGATAARVAVRVTVGRHAVCSASARLADGSVFVG